MLVLKMLGRFHQLSSLELLFVGKFLIIDSISLLVTVLFRLFFSLRDSVLVMSFIHLI